MRKLNIKKIWFVIYMFLAIFEPPILPVSFIYILGAFTVGLLLLKYGTIFPLYLPNKSGIIKVLNFFSISVAYLFFVGVIDIFFIEATDLFSNRIRCINQIFVLSLIQFLLIWYLLQLAEELDYELNDIFKNMIIVGALQGVCAVAAYTIPSIRSLFIRFGDSTLFNNAYFIERRGFGFSMTLIDTFGYGMGLLAGYLLLLKWDTHRVWKAISLVLMLFSIAVNARTGLVIFAISVVLKVLQGENKIKQIEKMIVALPIAYFGVFVLLPKAFKVGIKSSNVTLKWIATDMQELYLALFSSSTGSYTSLTEASFFSNFGNLPENIFELILGSGHSIYDTTAKLGFRTDIGYINLWWEFGLLGLIILLTFLFYWMLKPLRFVKRSDIRSIIILNFISYFLVLFKAILIGYNPGVFVNYLCMFSIYYYYRSRHWIE